MEEYSIPAGWGDPVGIPASCTMQIGRIATGVSAVRTVEIFLFGLNVYEVQLYESGGFVDDDEHWVTFERVLEYTFASDGDKTLYCAFRNPGRFAIGTPGHETQISANVSIDASAAYGGIAQIFDNIFTILRNNETLQAYDSDWASTTKPHVVPGWVSEEPSLQGETNAGRCPFVEIRTAPSRNEGITHGYFNMALSFQMRAYIARSTQDRRDLNVEHDMLQFLWDIMEALNAYPRLDGLASVKRHYPGSMDTTLGMGKTFACGQMDLVVEAGFACQDYNTP